MNQRLKIAFIVLGIAWVFLLSSIGGLFNFVASRQGFFRFGPPVTILNQEITTTSEYALLCVVFSINSITTVLTQNLVNPVLSRVYLGLGPIDKSILFLRFFYDLWKCIRSLISIVGFMTQFGFFLVQSFSYVLTSFITTGAYVYVPKWFHPLPPKKRRLLRLY